jgi:hypothetical protein
MMIKKYIVLLIVFIFSGTFLHSQTSEASANDSLSSTTTNSTKQGNTGFIFKPTIGLGTGMFSYFGDVYDKHFQAPMVSRIAYDLNVSQPFNDYLTFNFYVLFGRLGANERNTSNGRNLNFESQIRVGGLNLQYNFGNFLPEKRTASPYISLGIESFEFLSKTDLFDKSGNRYYYWNDGTIRNIDQSATNANTAIEIQRDYSYESDVRETNTDGFGKYAERSWAIPVSAGATFKINDYWNFKLGATMHFTFTDYIDGVSDKSLGNRVGNSKNDNFMMTSFSLHYNLGSKKKEGKEKQGEDAFKDIDFFALDMEDMDKDGVPDSKDSCQGTPPNVPVNEKGCPIDDDEDGVPNYMDDEKETPKGSFVDARGVQLNDSTIAYNYSRYIDSTGAFNEVEYNNHNGGIFKNPTNQKEYMVALGTFKRGLPAELMTKYLSINDIASTNIDDSTTVYTAGKFNSLLDAENRKKQLVAEGMKDVKVVYKQNGKFYDAPNLNSANTTSNSISNNNTNTTNTNTNTTTNTNENNNQTNTNNSTTNNNTTNNNTTNNAAANNSTNSNNTSNSAISNQGIVLRVQLGAYKNRLSKGVFKDVPNLIEIKTEDGLYKYMTGSFTTFDAAAKHKVDMVLKGYQGAFITAYKDGKRVSLEEAGATKMKKEDLQEIEDNTTVNALNTKLIVFKVQVGVFKNEPPAEKQELFSKLKNLNKETTNSGLNRYVVGSFNDYKQAMDAKNEAIKAGAGDAFIIALYNGEYIPIQEALELIK